MMWADKGIAPDPTTNTERRESPEIGRSARDLDAPVHLVEARRKEPSGNDTKEVEEIQQEPSHSQDAPPRPVRTFLRQAGGDLVEVVEEEEATEQELVRVSEHRARHVEKVAPLFAENKRLQESVEALEKSLAIAHSDKEKMQAHVWQVESENLVLTEQLSTTIDRENELQTALLLAREAAAQLEKERNEVLEAKQKITKELQMRHTNAQAQFQDLQARMKAMQDKIDAMVVGIKPMLDLIDPKPEYLLGDSPPRPDAIVERCEGTWTRFKQFT
ncbi:uncharacterized protein [Miscanthus floridulus]|uniref:uncharacterized protein n=1 Tax=Miscanthus floridulus TaxID=154761 RepID=UPI00345797AA